MECLVYTVSELAKTLNIGMNKAYELVSKPDFPKVIIGKRILIPKKLLEEWLKVNSKTID